MKSSIPWSVRIVKGGKADYVKWDHPEAGTIDVCVCSHNVDFTEGCIAHVVNEHFSEIGENGRYNDVNAILAKKDGRLASGCEYCYALSWNQGSVRVRQVTEDTRGDMIELAKEREKPQDRIIRLGKSTEVGHTSMRNSLIDFLLLCKEFEARVIFPTKMLEFDPRVAELLAATRSSLYYSICNDSMELGPLTQGFKQEWRIAQAKQYLAAGTQTSLTLVCDITGSLRHNERLGYPIAQVFAAHEQGLRLRLLPMRIGSRAVAIKATGRSWDALLSADNRELFDVPDGEYVRDRAYVKKNQGTIEPRVSHPDFTAIYNRYDGNRVGACGKANGFDHCDKCALQYGDNVPHIRVPLAQLAPYVNSRKEPQKRIHTLPLFRGTGKK